MKPRSEILVTAIILLLFYACGHDTGTGAVPSSEKTWFDEGKEYRRWVIRGAGARLREAPGPQGRVIEQLSGGTQVVDLEELSSFLTTIQLAEGRFDEPWWRVGTPSGKAGWVFGGLVAGVDTATLLEKRTEALFGKDLAVRLTAYREQYNQAATAGAVAACYHQGLMLREELVSAVGQYLDRHPDQVLPNLFWLSGVLPAFVPQLIAGKTAYHLFADYRAWESLARKTTGTGDDYFFQLCIRAFPTDSIEYFYPAWTISDGNASHPDGHSLLGRGVHRRMLLAIDQALDSGRFHAEIEALKNDLINDMIAPRVTYWEGPDSIAAEIERILSDSIRCLSSDDQFALESRLHQIQSDPVNIQTNYKNGAPSPVR